MSTLPALLELGPLPVGLTQRLQAHYRLHALWQEPDRAAFLTQHTGQFAGAVTMSRHGCPADVMACVAGRVVACFGTGYEGLDLAAAQQHQVQVSTTPDVLNDCVADLAFGLILATARQLCAADRYVHAGEWLKANYGLAHRVSGKRLGIVGLGRIGRVVAKRSQGFDMPVRYHGRHAQADVSYGFEADLRALAEWADFLVVTCPGGEATRGLINAQVLEALGPEGFLINVSRGSVIDEAALLNAVQQQRIGGVGLDVYQHEPHIPEALLNNPCVVALPHIAASTHETRAAMEALVADNLASFFATGRVLTPPLTP
jgi:hydroxypyruvate reductase